MGVLEASIAAAIAAAKAAAAAAATKVAATATAAGIKGAGVAAIEQGAATAGLEAGTAAAATGQTAAATTAATKVAETTGSGLLTKALPTAKATVGKVIGGAAQVAAGGLAAKALSPGGLADLKPIQDTSARSGAEARERERRRGGRGRAATILTTPLGLRGQPNIAARTLLG